MELNRYENVKRVVRILDLKINKLLKDDKMNMKVLQSLIEIRSIYLNELDGLTRSINTNKMYEKKYG